MPDASAGGFSEKLASCKLLPWREAGPPNHHDDKVDSDLQDASAGVFSEKLASCKLAMEETFLYSQSSHN